jgi:lipopolysaccharide assembly protein A
LSGGKNPPTAEATDMRTILGILLLAFLGAVAVFAVQNIQVVQVRFGNWSLAAPLALTVVASYLLGMVTGWTVVAFVRLSYRRVMAPPRE